MKSCSLEALRSPVSWPGLARSGPPTHLQGDMSSDATPLPEKHPTLKPRDKRGSGENSGLGCQSGDCSDVALQRLIL